MTMPKLPPNFDMQWWPRSRSERIHRTALRGGYVITGRTLCEWAIRNGKDLPDIPMERERFFWSALRHFEAAYKPQAIQGVELKGIGEVAGLDAELMMCTQYTYFAEGYLGMDPKDYPQHFEEGSLDREVKKRLERELGVELEFKRSQLAWVEALNVNLCGSPYLFKLVHMWFL